VLVLETRYSGHSLEVFLIKLLDWLGGRSLKASCIVCLVMSIPRGGCCSVTVVARML
jgi:hypothetical protein